MSFSAGPCLMSRCSIARSVSNVASGRVIMTGASCITTRSRSRGAVEGLRRGASRQDLRVSDPPHVRSAPRRALCAHSGVVLRLARLWRLAALRRPPQAGYPHLLFQYGSGLGFELGRPHPDHGRRRTSQDAFGPRIRRSRDCCVPGPPGKWKLAFPADGAFLARRSAPGISARAPAKALHRHDQRTDDSSALATCAARIPTAIRSKVNRCRIPFRLEDGPRQWPAGHRTPRRLATDVGLSRPETVPNLTRRVERALHDSRAIATHIRAIGKALVGFRETTGARLMRDAIKQRMTSSRLEQEKVVPSDTVTGSLTPRSATVSSCHRLLCHCHGSGWPRAGGRCPSDLSIRVSKLEAGPADWKQQTESDTTKRLQTGPWRNSDG